MLPTLTYTLYYNISNTIDFQSSLWLEVTLALANLFTVEPKTKQSH